MGSSGSGKFGNYPPSSGGGAGGSGGPGGPQGGSKDDQCARDLKDVSLEDAGSSTYFRTHKTPPAIGTEIALRPTVLGSRLVIDTTNGEDIGFLPTDYNYLLICMKKGFSYSGQVTSSKSKPIPSVHISLRSSR